MSLGRGATSGVYQRMMRGGSMLVGAKIARTAVTLSVTAVLARLLTPADFGVFAIAIIAVPMARAALEGWIDIPAIRDDDLSEEALRNLLWSGLLMTALLAFAILAAAPWLAIWLRSPDLTAALPFIAALLMLQPFFMASQALLRRRHAFGWIAIWMPLSALLFGICAIGLAASGGDWRSLLLAELISQAAMVLILVAKAKLPLSPPSRLAIRQAAGSGGISLVVSMQQWIWSNIDTVFASASLGPAGAGLYNRAYAITTQAKEPFAILEQVLRQAFVAQRDLSGEASSTGVFAGLRLITLISGLIAGALYLLAEPIVHVLLGSQWTAVTLPLAILVVSLPARIARGYVDSFAFARGSVAAMMRRNAILLALLLAGLIGFARDGLVEIAIVVTVVNVTALLFVGGEADRTAMGGHARRWSAYAPGHALLGLMIASAAAIDTFDLAQGIEWAVRLAVAGTYALAICVVVPSAWLLPPLARLRQRFGGVR